MHSARLVPAAARQLAGVLLAAIVAGCGAAPVPVTHPSAPTTMPTPATATTSPAAPAHAQQAAAGTARITGTIRSLTDEAPLARARVVASSDTLPEPRVTISAGDGSFALDGLPAGSYALTVTRTGYASATYTGASGAISLTEGQQAAGVDVMLSPGGVIAGRILDEDGSPFAGAIVNALVTRTDRGTDVLVSVASAETDDRGEFRLFGLAPGRYYVSASDPAFRSVSTPQGVLQYSPTYAPGTTFADQARTIDVTGTGQPPRVEFKLKLTPPARVSGQLVSYDGKQLLNGAVTMTPPETEGAPIVPPQDITILPDGRFSFGHVAPGDYQIRARGQTENAGAALFAVFSTIVDGRDIDGIRMLLEPGGQMDGTLVIQPARHAAPPAFSSLAVRAPFTDGNTFGDVPTGVVQPDGSFAIRGIMTGTHQIVVEGLQPPWVLKEVTQHGTNLTDLPIDVQGRQTLHDVRVVITDASSEVTGTVRSASKRPVANAGVLVFSTTPAFWLHTSRRVRVTFTDREGRFRVIGLPAGEYLAVASMAIDESDLGRHDRLQAYASLATPVQLRSDDGTASVDLQLAFAPSAVPAIR